MVPTRGRLLFRLNLRKTIDSIQESVSFPKQSFDPVAPSPTEEEQCVFLKRIQMVIALDDLRKTINAKAQIRVAAYNNELFDSVSIKEQGALPLPARSSVHPILQW